MKQKTDTEMLDENDPNNPGKKDKKEYWPVGTSDDNDGSQLQSPILTVPMNSSRDLESSS